MAIVAAVEEEAKAEASLAADKEEADAQDAQEVQEAEEAEEAKAENSDSEDMGACPPAPLLQAPEVVAVLQALAQRDIVETEAAIARAHGADIDPTVLTYLTEEPLRWLREREARRPFAAAELQRTLEAMELPALRVALVAALDTGVTGDVVEKATAALAVLEAKAAARSAAEAALQDAVAREDLDALPQAIEEAEAKGADVVLLSAARGSVRRLRQAVEDRRAADAALRSSLERQAEDPTSEAANVGVANALVQARACALDDAPLIERAVAVVEAEAVRAVERTEAAADLRRALGSVDTGWMARSAERAASLGVDAALVAEAREHLRAKLARAAAEEGLLTALLAQDEEWLRAATLEAKRAGVTGDVVEKATAALAVLEAKAAARSAAEAALQDAVAREDLDALPQAIEEAEAKGADVVLLSAARGSVRRLRQAVEDRRAADAALRSSLERQAEDPTSEAANVGVANALVQARACALDDAPLIERAAILVRLWQQEQEAKEAVARLQAAAEAEAAAAEAEEAEERRLEAVRARVREAEEAARREEEEHHALLEQQRVRREARIDEEHRRRKEAEEREEMEREQLREAVRKGAAVRKQGAAAASAASEASAGATGGGGSLLQQIRQRHAAAAADRAAATPPLHALSTSFLSSSALLSSSSSVVTVAAHGIGLGRCAPGQDPSGVMSSMPPLELDPDKTPAVLLAFASAGDADELVAAAAEAAGVGHRSCADKKEKAAVVQRL